MIDGYFGLVLPWGIHIAYGLFSNLVVLCHVCCFYLRLPSYAAFLDILSMSFFLITLVVVTSGVSSIFVAFSSYNLKLYSERPVIYCTLQPKGRVFWLISSLIYKTYFTKFCMHGQLAKSLNNSTNFL